MLIAKELKKTNISEYLIYMFQIEDLIRSNSCDFETLDKNLISKFKQPEQEMNEIRKWYKALCRMMNEERLQKSGHLQFVTNQIKELTDFHYRLFELTDDNDYKELYNIALQDIEHFRSKLPTKPDSDIEVCLYALYSLLLMRLKKVSLNVETLEAMTNFSNLMAYLSKRYNEYEKGEIEI
jgi:hypothetical protein